MRRGNPVRATSAELDEAPTPAVALAAVAAALRAIFSDPENRRARMRDCIAAEHSEFLDRILETFRPYEMFTVHRLQEPPKHTRTRCQRQ